MDKPIKPNVDLPDSFGGVKSNFSTSKILNGYEKDVPDIFGGANINYMLDTLGKRQTYYDTIVDFVNGLPIGKTITTDSNNKLIYDDLRVDLSGLANVDLSNLTATGEKHFLNKKQITNCILEAPNGVCNLWQGKIVVASGIKYLIPNGTNSDGTLKNIEVTSTSKIYNYPENDDVDVFLFLDQDGNTFTWLMRYTFIITSNVFLGTETGDAQTRLVYITRENQWYYTSDSGSTWVKAYICCVAAFHAAAQSVVYMLSEAPLHLFSDSKADIQQLTKLGFPTSVKTFPLALGASDSIYTAVGNGYIIFSCLAGGTDSFVYLQGIQSDNSAGVMSSSHATLTNQFMLVNIPVLKGQKFQLSYYNIAPTGISFGIVGAVGEDN